MASGDLTSELGITEGKRCAFTDGFNDRIDIDQSIIPTAAFSLSFYLQRRETASTNDRMMDFQDGGPNGGFTFVAPSGGEQSLQVAIRNGAGAEAAINSLAVLNTNQWYHICIAYTVNDAEYYIDGVSQGTDTSVTMTQPAANLTIGGRAGGGNNSKIAISDLQIHNKRVSTAEVASIIAGKTIPSLIHHYKFNGDVNDSVGSTNGTVVNEAIVYSRTELNQVTLDVNGMNLGATTDKLIAVPIPQRDGSVLVVNAEREA